MEEWWDLADAKHEDSKAERCQCGGEARYWVPGNRYVCWKCYQQALQQVSIGVVELHREADA